MILCSDIDRPNGGAVTTRGPTQFEIDAALAKLADDARTRRRIARNPSAAGRVSAPLWPDAIVHPPLPPDPTPPTYPAAVLGLGKVAWICACGQSHEPGQSGRAVVTLATATESGGLRCAKCGGRMRKVRG